MKELRNIDLDKYDKELYPDSQLREYVMGQLEYKGVSLEEMADVALESQLKFNPSLDKEIMLASIMDMFDKRETLNALAIGLALDEMCDRNLLPFPLQFIVSHDLGNFGVDEFLATYVSQLFGTIATTNGAYLDVVKHNVSKRLDESTDSSNTFIDDLVSAIIASAESKVAQTLTIDTRI